MQLEFIIRHIGKMYLELSFKIDKPEKYIIL